MEATHPSQKLLRYALKNIQAFTKKVPLPLFPLSGSPGPGDAGRPSRLPPVVLDQTPVGGEFSGACRGAWPSRSDDLSINTLTH